MANGDPSPGHGGMKALCPTEGSARVLPVAKNAGTAVGPEPVEDGLPQCEAQAVLSRLLSLAWFSSSSEDVA